MSSQKPLEQSKWEMTNEWTKYTHSKKPVFRLCKQSAEQIKLTISDNYPII